MIDVRPFAGLGHADHGWLDARHHFSFGDYANRARMGWGAIRVWNDDTIAPHTGFGAHPHRDMEIITYVRSGAISHRDSLGNAGRTAAGDVQVMSAGTGITHAEENREDIATTLFQIWVQPDRRGESPSWRQRAFPSADRAGGWVTVAADAGVADLEAAGGGVLPIRSDARVMAATLAAGQSATCAVDPARHQYLVAPHGHYRVNGVEAQARDGVAITGETEIVVEALADCELVLVDAR